MKSARQRLCLRPLRLPWIFLDLGQTTKINGFFPKHEPHLQVVSMLQAGLLAGWDPQLPMIPMPMSCMILIGCNLQKEIDIGISSII